MALSSQNFIFNLDKSFNSFQLYAKQNDSTGARSFIFNVFQNGKPFNLTGVTASVGGKKPDSKEVFNNVNILDTQNGEIEVPLSTQMLVVAGTLNLELIFFKDSARLSSYPFSISIVPNVTNFSSVQSTDEFNALSDAMGRVNSSIDNMNNKTNQAVADLKSNKIGTVNLFDNTDFSEPLNLYESTANVLFQQDVSAQSQSSIFYKGKKIIGISSKGDKFGDTYCTFIQTNDKVIMSNTTYTLSFWYISLHTGNDLQSSSFIYMNRNTSGAELIELNDLDLNSHGANWTRYTKTFTTSSDVKNIQLRLGFRCSAYSWMVVDGLKLEKGVVATDWSLSNYDIELLATKLTDLNDNLSTNTKQIASNSSSISDIQRNWFSDCSNSLCINGLTSLKVYAQGVYYITGDSETILQSIDHSAIKNGQCVYFIAETNSQTAAIKFPASLNGSGVYTPKAADFWITGRDNGDMIYRMQKMGGAMRFLA